jgi:hypothetical protein
MRSEKGERKTKGKGKGKNEGVRKDKKKVYDRHGILLEKFI